MCGQLIFNFFSEATNLAMVSIVNNSGLIKKVYIPKYIFPLSTVISTFVNLLFSMVALLVIMLATKVSISLGTLTFIIPLVYVLIISVGIGLILASYSVFFRDLLHLYNVFTMALI
jgi:ABC-2 type transport system permease protein